MKKLLRDRQSLKAGVLMALLFPFIYFGMSLLGWSNDAFSWWEALLLGLVQGFVFWFLLPSFRQFRDEDVTPNSFGHR